MVPRGSVLRSYSKEKGLVDSEGFRAGCRGLGGQFGSSPSSSESVVGGLDARSSARGSEDSSIALGP